MPHLNCPECGLTIDVKGNEPAAEHCPRCLARKRKAVRLNEMEPGELAIGHRGHEGRHTLELVGELDIATASTLEATIAELCAQGAAEITLDLSALNFIDSRGVSALLLSKRRCEARRCSFAVTGERASVQRVFDLTRLADNLSFHA